jgi:cupin fold WbuC family metalloprotein
VIHGYRSESAEVLYSEAAITAVNRADVAELKALAARNPRKRVRLCAHHRPGDKLHEMLIVHERSAYVRPHKHPGKSESVHIVEGQVEIVVFDDAGAITRVLELGEPATGRIFYYRMAEPAFHTLIVRSEVLVFHETTDGPFNRADTVFAPWAPADADPEAVSAFLSALENKISTDRNGR